MGRNAGYACTHTRARQYFGQIATSAALAARLLDNQSLTNAPTAPLLHCLAVGAVEPRSHQPGAVLDRA